MFKFHRALIISATYGATRTRRPKTIAAAAVLRPKKPPRAARAPVIIDTRAPMMVSLRPVVDITLDSATTVPIPSDTFVAIVEPGGTNVSVDASGAEEEDVAARFDFLLEKSFQAFFDFDAGASAPAPGPASSVEGEDEREQEEEEV